jgi:hypothetical protein
MNKLLNERKFHLLSLSTSFFFLMMTIERYYHWKNEFDHCERLHQMLHSITLQKRATLGNLINHINQLLLLFK